LVVDGVVELVERGCMPCQCSTCNRRYSGTVSTIIRINKVVFNGRRIVVFIRVRCLVAAAAARGHHRRHDSLAVYRWLDGREGTTRARRYT